MTTITPFAAGSYVTNRNTSQLLGLKNQLNDLSTQLSTGLTAPTYGGLGSGRSTALAAQSTLSALTGYAAGITAAQTRISVAVPSLTQVATLGTSTMTTLSNGLQSTPVNSTAAQSIALGNLQAALDILNQSVAGSYLFGGKNTTTQPVLDSDTILNGAFGSDGKLVAGLKTMVTDQINADLGLSKNGRLVQTYPSVKSDGTANTAQLTLAEDPSAEARANFGFSLVGASTTGAALSATYKSAVAAVATPSFQAAPTDGQSFRVVVNQSDGSQKTVDFTTTSNASGSVENPFPVFSTGNAATDAAAAAVKLTGLVAPGTIASVQSAGPTDTPPGPGLSVTFADSSSTTPATPALLTIGLTGTPPIQPSVGDTVSVTLKMHDGTTTTLTLTAAAAGSTTSTSAAGGTFAIGADAATTAANLSAALGSALITAASSTLFASSTARASQDFFAGSKIPGLEPRRIDFTSGDASGYVEDPKSSSNYNTVIWYKGEDGGTDPRSTQSVQVSSTSTINTGARANEPAVQNVLAGLATVALGLPSSSDANVSATYSAVSSRAQTLLSSANTSPSVQDIITSLSNSSTQLSNASTINTATQNTLKDTLDGIEQAPTEEVVAKLLDVQNRLQASYQITSSISKLSLVNYIS